MKSIKTAALLVGLCTAATAGAAMANPVDLSPVERVSVTVPYGDLDLTTQSGADTLRKRFASAVTTIKGSDSFWNDAEANQRARLAADGIIAAHRTAGRTSPVPVVTLG